MRFVSGETSDIWFELRLKCVRLLSPTSGETSDIWLSSRSNHVRFVRCASSEISEIWFPPKNRCVRFVANSMPVKSLTLLSSAENSVSVSISATVMDAASALPSSNAI